MNAGDSNSSNAPTSTSAAASALSSARWKAAASAHSNVNTHRNMILLEKKRKSHEAAANDVRNALLEETLAGLRQRALDLQDDQWLYDDVHI